MLKNCAAQAQVGYLDNRRNQQ